MLDSCHPSDPTFYSTGVTLRPFSKRLKRQFRLQSCGESATKYHGGNFGSPVASTMHSLPTNTFLYTQRNPALHPKPRFTIRMIFRSPSPSASRGNVFLIGIWTPVKAYDFYNEEALGVSPGRVDLIVVFRPWSRDGNNSQQSWSFRAFLLGLRISYQNLTTTNRNKTMHSGWLPPPKRRERYFLHSDSTTMFGCALRGDTSFSYNQ